MNIKDTKMYRNVCRTYNRQECEDIMNHGCSSGCATSHIYYADTVKWYNRYEDEIEELAQDMAEQMGCKNVFDFLASLNGANDVGSNDQRKNLLCWFAVEECCRVRIEG